MVRSIAFALIVLLAGCAAPLSQSPPPGMPATVAAPEIRVGDTWTYRVQDGFTGLPRGEQRLEVVAANAGRVEVAVTTAAGNSTDVYDQQWNWIQRPATNLQTFLYRPAYRAFDFPLVPGKTWRAHVTATDPADGRSFPVVITGKVLGWERVRVPAGEFDTLKIERYVYFEYYVPSVRGRSEIHEVEWYAPAARQSVKRVDRSQHWSESGILRREPEFVRVKGGGRDEDGGPRYVQDDWLVYELTGYSVH